jgi:protein phosphatase PTC7
MGVADGVGGWADSGVDPSLFSQALMYHAHRCSKIAWAGEPEIDPTAEDGGTVAGGELAPLDSLEIAYGGVLNERGVNAGSSTACIVHINASSGLLRAANLGDSGFVIIRSSSIIYSQPAQTHFFNCPLQLSKFPPPRTRWKDNASDVPQDADLYTAKLRDGDIVILFTDGLSDNVFDTELAQITSLVARTTAGASEDEQVQAMADRIVDYSRACMFNLKRVSPFEKAAKKEGKNYRGGKVDDVTVVVAMVRETA